MRDANSASDKRNKPRQTSREDRRASRQVLTRLVGAGKTYRPTRRDHFVDAKSLTQWLENHRLPVSEDIEENAKTMEEATGL